VADVFEPGQSVIWSDENGNRHRARVLSDDGRVAEIKSNDRSTVVLEFSSDLTRDES
jgi:hypothetical protein